MNTNTKTEEILYRDEVYQIVGAAMEVRNTLGFGFLEAVYHEALLIECRQRSIPVVSQVEMIIRYKTTPLQKKYLADLIAYEKIVVELKGIPEITKREEAQLLNYLKATHLRLGVILNFGNPELLEWKRMIL